MVEVLVVLRASSMVVKPNELVGLFVFNEGPNIWKVFHVIGAIIDAVYIDGNPSNVMHGIQTVNIPPAGGAVVNLYFDIGGKNPFVNHAFAYARGVVGLLQVENAISASLTTTAEAQASTSSGPVVDVLPGSAANTTKTHYSPPTMTVVIGVNSTIVWANDDAALHVVTATDDSSAQVT